MHDQNDMEILKLNTLLYLLSSDDIEVFATYVLTNNLDSKLFNDISSAADNRMEILNKLKAAAQTNMDAINIQVWAHLYCYLKNYNIYNNIHVMNLRDNFNIAQNLVTSIISIKDIGFLNEYRNMEAQKILLILLDKGLMQWVKEKADSLIKQCQCFDKRIISGLSIEEYQHSLDKEAIKNLEKIPKLKEFTNYFFEKGIDKFYKIQYIGSNYRVNPDNRLREYTILAEACRVLEIRKIPDLYFEIGFLNAQTLGVNETIIVITTDCIKLLNADELQFVMGHELGHIKSKHILYHQMAKALLDIGTFTSVFSFGISSIITKPLYFALLNWYRKSEFTADRAGLLACQNTEAAVSCMIKLSGYPAEYYNKLEINDFITQAKEFNDYIEKDYNKTIEQLNAIDNSHPWLVKRCAELIKWKESGEYDRILNANRATEYSDSIMPKIS